jgi:hypothetical protein
LDSADPGQGSVAGCRERCDAAFVSIKGGGFLDLPNNCQPVEDSSCGDGVKGFLALWDNIYDFCVHF